MSNGFWIRPQDRSFSAVLHLSAYESRPTHQVSARRKHRIGGLLLVLAVAACATRSPVKSLPIHSPSAQDPRDLALHIIEVDDDGEGDDIDMSEIERIETGNYGIFETEISPCKRAEEEARKQISDDEIVLREQFVCVIENAIRKHRVWAA
jgi:hypothetical protein